MRTLYNMQDRKPGGGFDGRAGQGDDTDRYFVICSNVLGHQRDEGRRA